MVAEIRNELDNIDLGDQRLNQRGRKLLETLFADPAASINAACHGWAETQAAYRFFNNASISSRDILAPHQEATRARIAEHPVVLVAQDTTELDYTDHPPDGAGPLNSEKQRGFLDHSHIAFTPQGLCLGMVEVRLWARSDEGFGESKKRQYDPLETKEKFRWLEGYRHACDLQRQVPQTQIISVSDSEGDIYELFVEVDKQGEGAADYVIRAGKTRCMTDLDPDAGPATYRKVQQEMDEAPLLTVRQLQLPRTPKREPRTATLEVRARRVKLKAPYRKHVTLPDVEINVVLVREVNAPSEEEAIEWLLITTLPIDTVEEVLLVVDYYTGRWPIEVFFRVFKTGCRVEEIQLETSVRLRRSLMLYKIVAWRILYLTVLGRECPELPCDVLFTADEWKPVWKITREDPIPEAAPNLKEFLLLLAELGGHNGRANDGAPGPQSLWVGMRRMTDFALAWRAFGPEHHVTTPNPEKTVNTCV
jgi:hypothetical protein